MEAARHIRHEGHPGLARRVLTGAGLGWIVMPVLVLLASAAAGVSSTDWIAPVVAAGILAGSVGLLIGAAGLGWSGLVGAVVGAIGGAMLPFLVVPPLLGFAGFDLGGAYGAYPPGLIAAVIVAAIGMVIGTRSGRRIALRPVAIICVGLVVLAVWFGFWFVVIPSLGRAA